MAELAPIEVDLAEDAKEQAIVDIGVDPKEAYERGKTDYNFFAALAIPSVMIFALPPFYVVVWNILVSRKDADIGKILRFALGLPRGHAKTTFIKVIICWLIVYDKVSFALMVCASESLAEQLLADIADMLSSPNIEAVYGRWSDILTTDTKELKKAFYHGRPVILAAKGAGSAVRGLNIKHTRPDLIFCDDMQTRENDESPTESLRLLRWMTATLLKLLAPRGNRLVIYVGNMYSDTCILKKLQSNPGWTSMVTGAILDNGLPLWPELHSLESLMESFVHDEALGEADIWFAEVMNDPKGSANSLLRGALPDCPYDDEIDAGTLVPDGVFITIDPAGFRLAADDNVISIHYVYDGKGITVKSLVSSEIPALCDPEQLILYALREALDHGASLIGVEDVGYQQSLQFWFNKYLTELQITGVTIVPLNPHGRSKEARIRQFLAELYTENWYIYGAIRAPFVWQAQKYKIGAKKNKDDLMDADAYALDVRNEYWHLVKNLKTERAMRQLASVVGGNTPF